VSRCAVLTRCLGYGCDDGRFRFSVHDCHVPTQTSQNLEAEQQILVYGITKSRIVDVFMLELMHQEQTNLFIA
jgi:hypothetical protein